ncbi:Uncharacterized protein Adt_18628 [Abeliophyllum distichum]|uniref:Uncharacterized protein n=1 Tax=Abeliophyllum distichum TaxID=126358 RepID=A0ABD1TJW7_9LAMI
MLKLNRSALCGIKSQCCWCCKAQFTITEEGDNLVKGFSLVIDIKNGEQFTLKEREKGKRFHHPPLCCSEFYKDKSTSSSPNLKGKAFGLVGSGVIELLLLFLEALLRNQRP